MIERVCELIRMKPPVVADEGLLFESGATVPTDATAGYQPGALFQDTTNGKLYINEGTLASCDFNVMEALTAAQEALLSATAGVATASKALILDSNGRVASGTLILEDMTPGTGISAVANAICEHRVTKVGGLYKTEILVDLTGLNSGDTDGDIIGKAGTANCHIGQITAAKNGTIFAGSVTCLETPAGGEPDIDLYSATEATGTEEEAVSGLTEAVLLDAAADWTAGTTKGLTANPAADKYLYLVASGGATNDTYTAGIFLITLWGK